jgi:hypothetical protein
MTQSKKLKSSDFKICPENIRLKNSVDWKDAHLSENKTVKRRKSLSA